MSNDTTMPELPDFDEIANQLVEEGVTLVSPSELQGVYSGMLSSSSRAPAHELLEVTRELLDVEKFAQHASKIMLLNLYNQSLSLLEASDFSFALLMPDEDESLELRTQALGQWCQGFLTGFGMSGKQQEGSLSNEIREALVDLSQIAQATVGVDVDDGSESDLYEVQEYVRMVAIAVFTEFNAPREEPKAAPTLH